MARTSGKRLEKERRQKAEEQAARQRAAQRRRLMLGTVAAVLVAGLAAGWILLAPEPPWVSIDTIGNDHIEAIDQPHIPYNSSPPSSGPHLGNLVPWDEYDEEIPAEVYVHNLEDGGVALTYNCPEGCDGVTETLRSVLADYDNDNVLLFPYDDIVDTQGVARTGAAVAWGRIYYFDDFSDPSTENELRDFIDAFEGVDHHVGAAGSLSG